MLGRAPPKLTTTGMKVQQWRKSELFVVERHTLISREQNFFRRYFMGRDVKQFTATTLPDSMVLGFVFKLIVGIQRPAEDSLSSITRNFLA